MRSLVSATRLSGLICSFFLLTFAQANAALPTDAVPESASIIFRWKAPEDSWGRLADIVDAVQPGFGGVVRSYLPATGQLFGVENMKGVNLDQDIWTIVFTEPQSMPTIVIILTAKDVEAFKKGLPEDYHVHVSDKVIAYSDDQDSLSEIVSRIDGKGKPLFSVIDANSVKTFESGDLSILVNVKQLVEDFADELKEAPTQIDSFIDQIAQIMPADQQSRMSAIFDVYRQLGKAAITCVHDMNSYTGAVTFSKSSIRYEDRLQISEGTATSQFLATQPATNLTLINRLPADKAIYLGTKFDMSNMIEWSMKITRQMFADLKAEQLEAFDKAVKDMSRLKYGESAVYADIVSKLPAFRVGTVYEVNPSDRLREITHTMVQAIGELRIPPMTQKTKVEKGIDKIDGIEVDRITTKQEFDENAPGIDVQKKMQKLFFGEEGMQQLILFPTNRTLQVFGSSVADLRDFVTAVNSKSASEPVIAEARKPAKK